MARKILFTSFKGGTGVTTVCIGLGRALAESGERTLIVDGDRLSGCAMTIAGLSNMQVYTLADYERAACRAKQTLVCHPGCSNLYIMPTLGLKDLSAANRAVAEVEGLFDYILFDKITAADFDGGVIVSEPFLPSVKSADCCRSALADGGIKDVSLVLNKMSGSQVVSGEIMSAPEIAAVLHLPLLAVIPEDFTISAGKWREQTKTAFDIAARNLSGRNKGIYDVIRGYSGINGFLKRKMRSRI